MNEITLVVDNREPKEGGWIPFLSLPYIRGTVKTGDLSIAGLEDKIAIERKTLSDLITCLSHQRSRFEEELRRSQGLDFFCVIIESNLADVAAGNYRSGMIPSSAWESIAALSTRYKVPFIFAGTAEMAAKYAESLLQKRYNHHLKMVESIERSLNKVQKVS